MTERFICQIDHLACHEKGLFCFGWALDPVARLSQVHLVLHFPDGSCQRVKATMGKPREDVALAFPGNPNAANSGFMMIAGWNRQPPERAELVFASGDGQTWRSSLALPARDPEAAKARVHGAYLLRRVWGLARSGRFATLWKKALHYYRGSARLEAPDQIALANCVAGRNARLVIDHSMGGGANLFRERVVADWIAQGDVVVLLSFRVSEMTPFVEIRDASGVILVQALKAFDSLRGALLGARLAEIFLNCAVSFPDPDSLRDFVAGLKAATDARLIIAIHEYFYVCPSHFLLDEDGRYCDIPGPDRCSSCLSKQEEGFVSLTGERSVVAWRQRWAALLTLADEVRCFSESSIRLMKRAFAGVEMRAQLSPHYVVPLRPVARPKPDQTAVVVGIIGTISVHKGAQVVADLAAAIERRKAPVRIVIIGSVDANCPAGVVTETGPYDQDELPDIVERHGIGIALLPSICPETFSFVAHEILSMQLPLMSFDLGAQADLVKACSRGRIARHQDGDGLLGEILEFAHILSLSGK
ncbi:hypothetical protein GCM10025771_25770 [Niveibacterium umoris]|uniref:Glycosyltransferase involved in cell wall biosynthesis n=1 Tax=Niveibacterium umoris TaxID=1193620 RepID=A0A840BGC8_9RHOO|nr:hypothetical protein [Niveibacterium umoris]MBB4012235.1 glycosyltransferase involved in cell wall biosynthesis [Niveibacterium umoris]